LAFLWGYNHEKGGDRENNSEKRRKGGFLSKERISPLWGKKDGREMALALAKESPFLGKKRCAFHLREKSKDKRKKEKAIATGRRKEKSDDQRQNSLLSKKEKGEKG